MLLYRQYARSERKTFFGLAAVLILLVLFSIWIFTVFKQSGAMVEVEKMLADLPGPMQAMFHQEFALTMIQGWLVNQFWRIEFPLIVSAFTAMGTVAILTKEADQGTLPFLLSLPISRTQVLCQRFAALLTGLAGLHVLVAVAMPLALILFGFPPEWGAVALMSLSAFMAQAAIAAILLLVTVFLDETPIATAVSLVLGLGLFLLTMLLKETGWQLALRRLSPFHYYQPGAVLQQGALPMGDTVVLVTIFVAATALALAIFNRKQVSS